MNNKTPVVVLWARHIHISQFKIKHFITLLPKRTRTRMHYEITRIRLLLSMSK